MSTPSLFDRPEGGPAAASSIAPPRFRLVTRVLLPVALITAMLGLLLGAAWQSIFPGTPVTVVPVMVKTVEGTVGGSSITATGWIEPDPYPYYATALVAGTVAEVNVLEGQRVEKGEPVAHLIDHDAKIALAAAEADLTVARGDLARAEAQSEAAQERLETQIELRRASRSAAALVAECEADLAKIDPEAMQIHAAALALKDELERKKGLVASGAVSEGEVRRLSFAVEAKHAEAMVLRARIPILEARAERARADRAAAEEALSRTIDERLESAVAEANVARASGAVARAAARRDEAQLALDRTVVRAPISGVVMTRLIAPGSPIQIEGPAHSAHIAHIYDPDHLQVRVDIPLADAAAVGVEQRAEISVSALPDQKFAGRVTRLVHEADLQKNTVEVKVAIEAPSALLKPEMLARVHFLAATGEGRTTAARERVLVPERLLLDLDTNRATVWVVDERVDTQGVAQKRSIELGATRISGWREVESGLQPGDWLVHDPSALSEGDQVTIAGEEEE